MKSLSLFTILAAALVVPMARADLGQIRNISAFPTMSVADARSTVTITAIIVNSKGSPVPDGTQVNFSTTLGTFRNEVVNTQGGRAQAILVAGGVPGTAVITVRTPGSAPATYEFEFLSDRALLSSAKEYVEIVAPGYMSFSMDEKTIGAAGPNRGVHIRYRDVDISADDMQLNIPTYELRLKKAKVKFGSIDHEFDECYIKLNQRRGFGTATYQGLTPVSLKGMGRAFAFVNERRPRYGLVEFNSSGVKPYTKKGSPANFTFMDLSESMSMVSAKKAVVFPRKEIQFQKAEVIVGGVKVMKMPLYSVSLSSGSTLVTDQIVNVNDNQLAIDYPYYLSLKPGETSALRLRTGQRYGRSSTASRGIFLDYELNWNRGDEMDGGLVVSNLARNDWSIGVRQYYRIDSRSTASAFLEMPSGKTIFGNASYSRDLDGWNLGFYANATQALRGLSTNNQNYSLSLERDPVKLGDLPFKLYYGISADYKYSFVPETKLSNGTVVPSRLTSQQGVGVHLRTQLNPTRLDANTMLNASLEVRHDQGRNQADGLTLLGTASVSKQIGNGLSVVATYDYTQNPFESQLIGQHKLSLQAHYYAGRTQFTFFGSKALDIDQFSYYGDASYRLSGLWRFMGSYTFDRFQNVSYLDYTTTIAYRLGIREFGLTWSHRTKRFGIQVFGASFN